jgi:hypothetical protein
VFLSELFCLRRATLTRACAHACSCVALAVEFSKQLGQAFRDKAPLTAAGAAKQILDGMRADKNKILVGEDAYVVDLYSRVR